MLNSVTHNILLCFNNKDVWKLADLCRHIEYNPDHATYYIKLLMKDGYLEQIARGQYRITLKGSVQLNKTKVTKLHVWRPRPVVIIVAKKGDDYILLRRKIQPFINRVEWPAGAIELGEPMTVAAERMTTRHLGRKYKTTFVGFFRQIETSNSEIVDDKLLAIHAAQIPKNDLLKTESDTGFIELHNIKNIPLIQGASSSLVDIYQAAISQSLYEEHIYSIAPGVHN